MFEFTVTLGVGALILVIVGALLFGVAVQLIGETKTGYEWLVAAIGAGIGAIVASEFVVGWQAMEPMWDGLALVPALVGGLVVGIAVDVLTRFATGGSYRHHHMAA